MRDTCLLSGIRKMFVDEDTLFVWDSRREGVFVFTGRGDFITQINPRGNGPEEFVSLSSFTVDPVLNHVCIYDMSSLKIVKYTYQGDFVKTYRTDSLYTRDFVVTDGEDNLFFFPVYAEKYSTGVWLADTNGVTKKIYRDDVPKDDQFGTGSACINRSDKGVYYYDPNRDDFSCITKDTMTQLFRFNLKQKVPYSVRTIRDVTGKDLMGYATMSNFTNSDNHLLLSYCIYDEKLANKYKWVLFDKSTAQVTCSWHLVNDLDDIQSDSNELYYLNDSTWCRLLDSEADDCNLHLQILHL
jgi:hypothetical protein